MNPTHTIYKSDKILFDYDSANDNRKVIATENISQWDLLILEHGITDVIVPTTSNDDIISRIGLNILFNEDLYNELYPRKSKYNLNEEDCDMDNITENINKKINKNAFKYIVTDKIEHNSLFRDITNLNHSVDSNANLSHFRIEMKGIDFPIVFYCVFCCRDILKGSEICINYGNGYFNENTDLTNYYNMSDDYKKQNGIKIMSVIRDYMHSEDFRNVIYNHFFYSHGIIFENNAFFPLSAFYKIWKGDENAELSCDEIETWISFHLNRLSTSIKEDNNEYKKGKNKYMFL